jgi:hypothetical protein
MAEMNFWTAVLEQHDDFLVVLEAGSPQAPLVGVEDYMENLSDESRLELLVISTRLRKIAKETNPVDALILEDIADDLEALSDEDLGADWVTETLLDMLERE